MSTDENDIVLDPFNGTGTTAIAAKRLGKNFIGIDIDKSYIDITYSKLELEESASKLGNKWVSYFLDEIVSLRDIDWEELKVYYYIPENPIEIDYQSIILKSKINASLKRFDKSQRKNLVSLF